jgi:(1->4)-alpha-D-glucan 1-alpha-D-glucosylmutase
MADPDNRRPVDFAARQALLDQLMPWILCAETIRGGPGASRRSPEDLEDHVRALLATWADGRIKAFVTACGLRLRKQERALFRTGDYLPLAARGAAKAHLVAFSRSLESKAIVVAVPRLIGAHAPATPGSSASTDLWQDTHLVVPAHLADAVLVNVLTGARLTPALAAEGPCIPATDLFRTCPVALLSTPLPSTASDGRDAT